MLRFLGRDAIACLPVLLGCGMTSLAQPAPTPIGVKAEILNLKIPRFSRFSVADALRTAYPGITVDGAAADTLRLRIRGVQAVAGSFLALSDEGVRGTGPALAMLVHKVDAAQDEESWEPELLLFQESAGALTVVMQATLQDLSYSNILALDTGSKLTLFTLPLAESGSALAVTLRASRGTGDFGQVRATTHVCLLRPPAVKSVLALETETARIESYYSVEGNSSKAERTAASLSCASMRPGGLGDIVVSVTEEKLRDSRKTVSGPQVRNYAWSASSSEYKRVPRETPKVRERIPPR